MPNSFPLLVFWAPVTSKAIQWATFLFYIIMDFRIFIYLICFSHIYMEKARHPTPVLLLRKSHGWRSLVGCSPWGHEELDMTERLHFCFSLSRIGEGNGNPLQCSCLENPRDGGAWWAAVSGVAQSRTRLKQLSTHTHSWYLHLINSLFLVSISFF